MHLSIKFSKKNFGGILRPKSVRRPLVIGQIYGLREELSKIEKIDFHFHQKSSLTDDVEGTSS